MKAVKVRKLALLIALVVSMAFPTMPTDDFFKTRGMEAEEKEASNPVRGFKDARPFRHQGLYVMNQFVSGTCNLAVLFYNLRKTVFSIAAAK